MITVSSWSSQDHHHKHSGKQPYEAGNPHLALQFGGGVVAADKVLHLAEIAEYRIEIADELKQHHRIVHIAQPSVIARVLVNHKVVVSALRQ